MTVGVLGDEARQLIAPFYARTTLGRPYVTLKWAVSADDKVAGRMGTPAKISGNTATAAVHALRGRCDAVAVATNTVRNDDPLLTARTPDAARKPLRVVFSKPPDAAAGGQAVPHAPRRAGRGLRRRGGRQRRGGGGAAEKGRRGGRACPRRSTAAAASGFRSPTPTPTWPAGAWTHLLIEPGPKLAKEILKRNQADRAWVIRGRGTIGGDGMPAPQIDWPEVASLSLEEDVLSERLNPASDAYFAPRGVGGLPTHGRSVMR